ncbi:DUF1707 domain-containing protein [Saccharothrix sp. 6-C]|uniref:DUF1707 SHOCT-like domain-containing protein n=1 Tax=Saccharothrix sp. 6-C TaxID=2781735 RepID=UPI001AF45DD0|nr:DUF1707 domain-containing protein [Saccharothrix sp. 6-C]QQQ75941.1 DUF1707 domain-containing protein [Saccharothrix sp. 6-C]
MNVPHEPHEQSESFESFTRAVDNDRAATVEVLSRAHAEGRLTLAELDERTRAVYEAGTYAELGALTADLPRDAPYGPRTSYQARTSYQPHTSYQPPTRAHHAPPPPPPERRRWSTTAKVVAGAWFAASFVNFLIWGIISLSLGEAVYPWWIWVAGPWGLLLLVGHQARFGRSS